ncbi:adenylate/guanylate cyclase domain-containing protein [uncultured Chloroflexus sp.]|uniref:adenylate/guanylate cyclase domain-containing protein n=1 Tax=uncultured Chloroflexus sp. TaxID=214040 RepID=UPI0026321674|nr:adenylate/guanylate cyclase domain-containing protein [uncultured Chloroflexus sp.]
MLFFGFTISLANATGHYYLQLLRTTPEQLKVFSEWLLGKELLNTSLSNPEQLHQQRQQRVILFMDIRGFTQWSEQHLPEETVTLLGRYYQTIEQVFHQHQIIKWKLSADEVMAIFAQPHEALSAALQRQRNVSDLLAREQLGAGIGIHYGLAVEGILGSNGIKFYNVIGDTVNTAKRIESAARNGEILVSEEMYRVCASRILKFTTRTIQAKGKSHPIIIYALSANPAHAKDEQWQAQQPLVKTS